MAIIVPAILTDNEEEYQQKLLVAEKAAEIVQVDIVDGKFAKNITVGPEVVDKYLTSAKLEVQLMVVYPDNYIDKIISLDYVWRIVVPLEIDSPLGEIIYHVKNHQKQIGISLNPQTPVAAALHWLDDVDLLLLLGVNPGFAGQEFQRSVITKISTAKNLVGGSAVEVDGGVNFDNVSEIAQAGADFIAANTVLFKSDDFYGAYGKLNKLANPK